MGGNAMGKETNYQILINSENKIPEGFADTVELVEVENPEGSRFRVEKKTYEAFLKLQADIRENDGLEIALLNSYRTLEAQQKAFDNYFYKFGLAYAEKYAARPGCSEHHTGFAIDVSFWQDGKLTHSAQELLKLDDLFRVVHKKLAKYGFLLRYPRGKEEITKINYEPWHYRYIDDPALAQEIADRGICFEEYWQTR
jgi:D-alanyl-D-alanine carboxypeptidase